MEGTGDGRAVTSLTPEAEREKKGWGGKRPLRYAPKDHTVQLCPP